MLWRDKPEAQALLRAIEDNTQDSVDITQESLYSEDISLLADAMRSNTSVRSLSLNIPIDSYKAVGDMVAANNRLISFNMGDVKTGIRELKQFLDILKRNKSINHFSFGKGTNPDKLEAIVLFAVQSNSITELSTDNRWLRYDASCAQQLDKICRTYGTGNLVKLRLGEYERPHESVGRYVKDNRDRYQHLITKISDNPEKLTDDEVRLVQKKIRPIADCFCLTGERFEIEQAFMNKFEKLLEVAHERRIDINAREFFNYLSAQLDFLIEPARAESIKEAMLKYTDPTRFARRSWKDADMMGASEAPPSRWM